MWYLTNPAAPAVGGIVAFVVCYGIGRLIGEVMKG